MKSYNQIIEIHEFKLQPLRSETATPTTPRKKNLEENWTGSPKQKESYVNDVTIGLTPSRTRVARVLYARGPRGMRLCGASNYLNPVNIPRNKRGERKEEEEEEEEVGPARPVGDG